MAFVDNNGEETTVHHNDCELFLQPEDLCCSVCKAYKHTLSSKASRSKKPLKEISLHSHTTNHQHLHSPELRVKVELQQKCR